MSDATIRTAVRSLLDAAPPAPPFPVATRRRSRPLPRIVLAMATAAIVVAGVLAHRSGDEGPVGIVLVARESRGANHFSAVDLASREIRDVSLPGMGRWGNSFYPVVQSGDRLVYLGEDSRRSFPSSAPMPEVFSYPDSFEGRRRTLGRADALVPSARPGYVWLVDRSTDRFDTVVREVSVMTGEGSGGDRRRWRVDGEPLIGLPGGLLLHRVSPGREHLVVWRPGEPEEQRTIASSPVLLYGGMRNGLVVVGERCDETQKCFDLLLVDVETGEAQEVPRPSSVTHWVVAQDLPRVALSPSAEHLVVPVTPGIGRRIAAGYSRIVINRSGKILRRFEDVVASSLWAARSEWVVVQLLDSLELFSPKDGKSERIDLPFDYGGPAVAVLS